MHKRAILFAIAAVLLVVGGGSLLLHGSSTKHTPDMQMDQTSQAAVSTTKVMIANFAFQPMTIKVQVGTTVTWTNQDTTQHSVAADSQSAAVPKSALLSQGQTYSFTFTKPGTYTYHCVPHLGMHGTVIVTN